MNKETHFLHTLQNVTMSTVEKTRLRDELSLYADTHPFVVNTPSPTFISVLMSSRRFPVYATLTAIVVLSSSASTLAAESSVPGDAFYAIKIHLNEPVMSAFSPSIEGQARVSSALASRRAEEVVTLASTGRLTPEKQDYLDTAFTEEVEKAKEHTDALSKRGDKALADEVTADFTVRLAGEAQALASIQTPTPPKTRTFLRKVIALSSGEQDASLPEIPTEENDSDEEAQKVQKPNINTTAFVGTTSARAVAATKKVKTIRILGDRQVRGLLIPASTTLTHVLETSSHITPKTDRAIQEDDQEHKGSDDGELRLGQ